MDYLIEIWQCFYECGVWSCIYENRGEIATWFGIISGILAIIEIFFQPFRRFRRYLRRSSSKIKPIPTPEPTEPNDPLFAIPIRNNRKHFIGREDVIVELEQYFADGDSYVVLTGLGGIGKSYTAAYFAYSHQDSYEAIFWVVADTQANLLNNFGQLTANLSPEPIMELDKQIAAVRRWLEGHQNWLLVLDNVEPDVDWRAVLSDAMHGNVLLTSRKRAFDGDIHQVQLPVMSAQDAEQLLLSSVEQATDAENKAAKALAEALGYLPLALKQASAYINQTGCSVADYLKDYQKLGYRFLRKGQTAPDSHPEPVTATWKLSYRKLADGNSGAIELLKLCAFLDADEIPEEIFTQGVEGLAYRYQQLKFWQKWRNRLFGGFKLSWTDERRLMQLMGNDDVRLNEILSSIQQFSLLQRDANNHMLSMHRLVQEDILAGLTPRQQKEYALRAVRLLAVVFPYDKNNIDTWSKCERLLTSSFRLSEWIKHLKINAAESGLLLHWTAVYLKDVKANYNQSLLLFNQALEIRENVLGETHVDVANTLNSLSTLFSMQGKYDEQLDLLKRSLAIWEKVLGENHPNVAASLNNLAGLYRNQGEYEKALPLYQRSLAILEKVLGENHPDVAISLNNLALLYDNQGEHEKAFPLYERSLAIWEKVLGENHPDVATSLNNLAGLYYSQGQYEQALPLYERAINIVQAVFDKNHPSIELI